MEGQAVNAADQTLLDNAGNFKQVFQVILVFVLILLIIATTIPIDGGVAASGTIAVEYLKKPIQHPSGGFIKKVFVKEGESVLSGQPLVELISSDLSADFQSSTVKEYSLLITRYRLRNELEFNSELSIPQDIKFKAQKNEILSLLLANEIRQFNSRRDAFLNEKQTLQEREIKMAQEMETIQKLVLVRGQIHSNSLADLEMRQRLLDSGYISNTGLLEYQTKTDETLSRMLEEGNNLKRVERDLADIRFKLVQMKKDWHSQVIDKLVEIERELALISSKNIAALEKYNQLILKSPANGKVINILFHDEGAVLNPGQVVMSVIPEDERRIVVAKIPSHQIDGVVSGVHARLKFTGKSSVDVFDGIVENVSADKTDDERTGTSFYTARISLPDAAITGSGTTVIMVGMPVEVLFTLESRTFFSYLVKPLRKFFDHAIREK